MKKKEQVKLLEGILNSCMKLESWREKFNGTNYGYGYDERFPNNKYHYPEAYGMFATGYINLYRISKNDEHLNRARECLEWLVVNKSPSTHDFCWGQPWKWECIPPNDPQVVQTIFSIRPFFYYYKITKNIKYLNIAKSTVKWLLSNYVHDEKTGEHFFWYTPHNCNKHFIVNSTAEAIGFLGEFSKYIDEHTIKITKEIVNFIIKSQNKDGSWLYGFRTPSAQSENKLFKENPSNIWKVPMLKILYYRPGPHIDNVHTAYVLEGLWKYYNNIEESDIIPFLHRGNEFYWNKFFNNKGYGRHIVPLRFSYFPKAKISRIAYSYAMEMFRIQETTAWGYGSGIRAFVEASYVDKKYLNQALVIAKYLINHLQDESGYIYYRSNDKSCYVRHQADIFCSLTFLLLRLHEISNAQI